MLSVVIVNWNTAEHLRHCLRSLTENAPSFEVEVIVVDNASSDGSAAMVEAEFSHVRLLAQDQNLGYAAGNNVGISAAKGELVLLLNPDTVISEGALDAAVRALEGESEGILAVQLILPDGSIQRSVRGFPTVAGLLGAWLRLDRLFPQSVLGSYTLPHFDYSRSQFCPQPMGTFLLFSRAVLSEAAGPDGVFDENFPIFFNEVDLLYRLASSGKRAFYCAETAIDHVHGAGTSQNRRNMIWESHRSLVRYLRKHLRGASRIWLPLIAGLSNFVAFVRARGVYAGFRP